jgi:hypothetical protein
LLVIDEKDKFKWRGNLTQFERFVEDILCVKGKWNTPGGGSRQIMNEKIGFRFYDTGTINLCGPKVEEYNEKLQDIAQECKLDQQDQASPVNVSVDQFNCQELGMLDMASTLNTNELNEQSQNQASPVNVSVDERLLNVADYLFGESVAQAEPIVYVRS